MHEREPFHVKQSDDSGGDEPSVASGAGSPPPAAAEVFGDRLPLAEMYHRVLATDGIDHGLIGPREIPRLWERHIMNCAVIEELVESGARVYDLGSGAGLPGLPLAIARPDLAITLVEPLLRRSEFLSRVVAELQLPVTVVRGRAEERSVRIQIGTADVVTSRALAPLDRLARWSAPLIRDGGQLVAIKGASAAEEIERDRTAVAKTGLTDVVVRACGEGRTWTPTTVVTATMRGGSRSSRRSSSSVTRTRSARKGR